MTLRPLTQFRRLRCTRPGFPARAVIFALALGACESTDAASEAAPAAQAAAPPAAALTVATPVVPDPAPESPAAAAKPERSFPPLASLIGADDDGIRALLGPPGLRRVDAPAEVWLYRAALCALDLFLYPKPGGGHAVAHAEVRPLNAEADGAAPGADACVASVIRAFEGRTSG